MSAFARHARWPAALLLAAAAVPILPRPAAAEDLYVSSAALDQPRINVAFAPASTPTSPFIGEGFDEVGNIVDSIQINAYWDTGASGIVLSPGTAELLGMQTATHGGQPVIFSDVSPGGPIDFNVSEPIVMRLGPSLGIFDGEVPYAPYFYEPSNFMTSYEASGPVPLRIQVGPVDAVNDINVVGMPSMIGRKAVWDNRPTDNIITLLDEDPNNDNFDAFMRSYSYPGTAGLGTIPAGSSDILLNPGIPTADVTVSLSMADFGRYTELSPPGATGPDQTHNPFLGPNPLEGPQPGDGPAPILRRGNLTMEGSWLLDSGAAASFISQQKAASDLNVVYSSDPNHTLGSDDPQLVDSVTGQLIPNQFQIPIQGISGEILFLAGFYADSLTVFTDEGDWDDPNDPNHLHYVAGPTSDGAPVLVFDITLQNPDDPLDIFTLDGIFGMNFMTASVDGDFTAFPPPLFNFNFSPFDGIVFDEQDRKLYFSFNDGAGWPIPEPGAALLGLGLIGLLLARRRTH